MAAYERMHQAALVAQREVVAFVRSRELHRAGLGWVDVHLLASLRSSVSFTNRHPQEKS